MYLFILIQAINRRIYVQKLKMLIGIEKIDLCNCCFFLLSLHRSLKNWKKGKLLLCWIRCSARLLKNVTQQEMRRTATFRARHFIKGQESHCNQRTNWNHYTMLMSAAAVNGVLLRIAMTHPTRVLGPLIIRIMISRSSLRVCNTGKMMVVSSVRFDFFLW